MTMKNLSNSNTMPNKVASGDEKPYKPTRNMIYAWQFGNELVHVTLTLNDNTKTYTIHRDLLTRNSAYMRDLLCDQTRRSTAPNETVTLSDLCPISFQVIFHYFYTGHVQSEYFCKYDQDTDIPGDLFLLRAYKIAQTLRMRRLSELIRDDIENYVKDSLHWPFAPSRQFIHELYEPFSTPSGGNLRLLRWAVVDHYAYIIKKTEIQAEEAKEWDSIFASEKEFAKEVLSGLCFLDAYKDPYGCENEDKHKDENSEKKDPDEGRWSGDEDDNGDDSGPDDWCHYEDENWNGNKTKKLTDKDNWAGSKDEDEEDWRAKEDDKVSDTGSDEASDEGSDIGSDTGSDELNEEGDEKRNEKRDEKRADKWNKKGNAKSNEKAGEREDDHWIETGSENGRDKWNENLMKRKAEKQKEKRADKWNKRASAKSNKKGSDKWNEKGGKQGSDNWNEKGDENDGDKWNEKGRDRARGRARERDSMLEQLNRVNLFVGDLQAQIRQLEDML